MVLIYANAVMIYLSVSTKHKCIIYRSRTSKIRVAPSLDLGRSSPWDPPEKVGQSSGRSGGGSSSRLAAGRRPRAVSAHEQGSEPIIRVQSSPCV